MSLKSVQLAKVDIESGPSSGGDVPVAQTDGPLKRDMTLWGFFANNLNAIIGAGVLGLPYSIGQLGIVVGTIMLLFGAFLSWWEALVISLLH